MDAASPPERPVSPPRRYAPYARPTTAASRDKSNYHWHTVCAIRASMMRSYDELYATHDRVRRGEPVGERELQRVLMGMADVLTCGVCGQVIPRLDNSCFLARCGHVYHKGEEGCWERAGRVCHLPACREPGRPAATGS